MAFDHVWSLEADGYENHPLHGADRDWPESNCYIDIWIEALHAFGLDVYAMLPFTLASDFEGDQWTFYKPKHDELEDLYGFEIQELTLWRSLVDHCVEQTKHRRMIFVEMDAFHLPDTEGTDYKRQHTKTSIGVVRIDPDRRWLGYFHNRAYHELEGEDFDLVFRVGERPEGELAPYAELVKTGRVVARPTGELVELSLGTAKRHLALAPSENPLTKFAERLPSEIDWLIQQDLETYHLWVFAGVRQCGSSFDFTAHWLRWLARNGRSEFEEAAEHFAALSEGCKVLVMKLARVSMRKQPVDLAPDVHTLGEKWTAGMESLRRSLA